MRKEVWRDVILSSVAFLALMWVAFFWAQKYFPMEQDSAAVAKVEEKKVAYLTFDDGPSKHTQEVLDILDTYHKSIMNREMTVDEGIAAMNEEVGKILK